ncbi:putative Zinc finger, RING/FYVE/PHD-type [Medicago truncatula]|uniref:Putative Zinc finger, RING/FYVE/PHD-type n=1 Tax=Medicago truncatula TaxID=3880 RepID=A0A396GLU5_MEDTR|nr:putative Zinc finger, RING/FYVE/PHD-type [Medicago truncatula]
MYFCFIILGNFNYFIYNALDALRLISFEDEDFHCEHCNGKLEVESDKLAAQEGEDGDENARRRRREKLKDMLQKMEVLISFIELFVSICGFICWIIFIYICYR